MQQNDEQCSGLLGHQRHAEALVAEAEDLAGAQQHGAPRGVVLAHVHHRRQPPRLALSQVLLHALAVRRVGEFPLCRLGRLPLDSFGGLSRLGRLRSVGEKEEGFGGRGLRRSGFLGGDALLLGGAHLPPEVVHHRGEEVADLLVLVHLEVGCRSVLLVGVDVLVVEGPRLVRQNVGSVDLPLPFLEEIVGHQDGLLQEVVVLALATDGLGGERKSEHELVAKIAHLRQYAFPLHLQLGNDGLRRLCVVDAANRRGQLTIRRDCRRLVLLHRLLDRGRGVHLLFHAAQADADRQRAASLRSHQVRRVVLGSLLQFKG